MSFNVYVSNKVFPFCMCLLEMEWKRGPRYVPDKIALADGT